MKKKIKSPCIQVCEIDQKNGLCRGCARTLDEIAAWISYSDEERERIMNDLKKRHSERADPQ